MNQTILDNDILDLKEVKRNLKKAGFKKFYEKKNDIILVQESDSVQVKIKLQNNSLITESVFPQIGNTVQVLFTLSLMFVFFFADLPFSFIAAILVGQLISFAWHYPKIKKLQLAVNQAIN